MNFDAFVDKNKIHDGYKLVGVDKNKIHVTVGVDENKILCLGWKVIASSATLYFLHFKARCLITLVGVFGHTLFLSYTCVP